MTGRRSLQTEGFLLSRHENSLIRDNNRETVVTRNLCAVSIRDAAEGTGGHAK